MRRVHQLFSQCSVMLPPCCPTVVRTLFRSDFGMSQDEVIEIFGNPDAVSTMRSHGKPLILKYHDIELHFDRKAPHGLCLV